MHCMTWLASPISHFFQLWFIKKWRKISNFQILQNPVKCVNDSAGVFLLKTACESAPLSLILRVLYTFFGIVLQGSIYNTVACVETDVLWWVLQVRSAWGAILKRKQLEKSVRWASRWHGIVFSRHVLRFLRHIYVVITCSTYSAPQHQPLLQPSP